MPVEYYCEKCDYKTNRKSSYTRHNKSNKHLYGVSKKTNDNDSVKCTSTEIVEVPQLECNKNIKCKYCDMKMSRLKEDTLIQNMIEK